MAYHQIGVYRRDQTSQPGVLPTRFNRDYWKFAVGRHEESPVHGDLKFLDDWDPDRPAWTLRPTTSASGPTAPPPAAGRTSSTCLSRRERRLDQAIISSSGLLIEGSGRAG